MRPSARATGTSRSMRAECRKSLSACGNCCPSQPVSASKIGTEVSKARTRGISLLVAGRSEVTAPAGEAAMMR